MLSGIKKEKKKDHLARWVTMYGIVHGPALGRWAMVTPPQAGCYGLWGRIVIHGAAVGNSMRRTGREGARLGLARHKGRGQNQFFIGGIGGQIYLI